MKLLKTKILFVLFLLILQSCGIIKMNSLMRKATVATENVETKIPFKFYQNEIFVELEIEAKKYNFIFDTAADLTVVHERILESVDHQYHTKGKFGDASSNSNRLNLITLPEININDVKFEDVGAVSANLEHFTKRINCPKIDGLIGTNIISKLNWRIDYENRTLSASSKPIENYLKSESNSIIFETRKLGRIEGDLKIDGKDIKATIDTGFTGGIKINGKKSKIVWSLYPESKKMFRTSESGGTLHAGGNKNIRTEYIKSNSVSLNLASLGNQVITLSNGSNLIGNSFLENYLFTLNYSQKRAILTPAGPIEEPFIENFELLLHPNYDTGKIEIIGFMQNAKKDPDIDYDKLEIIALNDYIVSGLDSNQLCSFWEGNDNPYRKSDRFVLKVKSENGLEEITLNRRTYL